MLTQCRGSTDFAERRALQMPSARPSRAYWRDRFPVQVLIAAPLLFAAQYLRVL